MARHKKMRWPNPAEKVPEFRKEEAARKYGRKIMESSGMLGKLRSWVSLNKSMSAKEKEGIIGMIDSEKAGMMPKVDEAGEKRMDLVFGRGTMQRMRRANELKRLKNWAQSNHRLSGSERETIVRWIGEEMEKAENAGLPAGLGRSKNRKSK